MNARTDALLELSAVPLRDDTPFGGPVDVDAFTTCVGPESHGNLAVLEDRLMSSGRETQVPIKLKYHASWLKKERAVIPKRKTCFQ